MKIFPLPVKVHSYKSNWSCRFGAPRDPGRKHGGCDLAARAGTAVLAIDDGVVLQVSSNFKYETSVVDIGHGDLYDDDYCIVRYGEVDTVMVKEGASVKRGAVIAKVGKQPGGTQLHLEMYRGDETGEFLQENNPPYKRRGDIIDPTPYLDSWEVGTDG